jgi:hypothetical protein
MSCLLAQTDLRRPATAHTPRAYPAAAAANVGDGWPCIGRSDISRKALSNASKVGLVTPVRLRRHMRTRVPPATPHGAGGGLAGGGHEATITAWSWRRQVIGGVANILGTVRICTSPSLIMIPPIIKRRTHRRQNAENVHLVQPAPPHWRGFSCNPAGIRTARRLSTGQSTASHQINACPDTGVCITSRIVAVGGGAGLLQPGTRQWAGLGGDLLFV